MSEFKYTTDGKKVVVIGNLNSKEIIVQEIFVSDGAEIPSGEHFLVKSLHDAPVESWKDKNLRKREDNYKRSKSRLTGEVNRLENQIKTKKDELRIIVQSSGFLADQHDNESVATFLSFLSGDITHLVFPSQWNGYEIKTLAEAAASDNESYHRADKLKLLSLYGDSKGNLQWGLHQYHCGSGQTKTIIPCTSYDDAVQILERAISEKIAENGTTSYMLKAKEKYGLSVPSQCDINKFHKATIEQEEKYIAKEEAKLEERRIKIAEIREKVSS